MSHVNIMKHQKTFVINFSTPSRYSKQKTWKTKESNFNMKIHIHIQYHFKYTILIVMNYQSSKLMIK